MELWENTLSDLFMFKTFMLKLFSFIRAPNTNCSKQPRERTKKGCEKEKRDVWMSLLRGGRGGSTLEARGKLPDVNREEEPRSGEREEK